MCQSSRPPATNALHPPSPPCAWRVARPQTTHGGLEVLSNFGKDYRNGTIIDYGSLIWLTLQRAGSAREAIDVMVTLANTYGYASDMEGFSIADSDEVMRS